MAKSCLLYAVALLGFLAVSLQLTGVVSPYWLRIRTDLKEIDEELLILPSDVKELDIDINVEDESELEHLPKPLARREASKEDKRSSSIEEEMDKDSSQNHMVRDQWFLEFVTDVANGDKELLIEHKNEFKIALELGFVFSQVCAARVYWDPENPLLIRAEEKHCKSVSTESALEQFGFLFNRPVQLENNEESKEHVRRSCHGWGRLNLQRASAFMSVVLALVGLSFGTIGFRKPESRKCFQIFSMLSMFSSAAFMCLQVTGTARLNILLYNSNYIVACPLSAILAGIGGLFAAICFIVTLAGVCTSVQKQAPGRWYRFNNDLVVEKKPSLVFLDDALPEKTDLDIAPAVSDSDLPQELLQKANSQQV